MLREVSSYRDLSEAFPGISPLVRLEERGEIEFRSYQAVAALVFARYGRGVIRLATGSGKTLLTALILAMHQEKALVVLYGSALINQTRRELERFLQEPIGLIEADTAQVERVTVVSVPTLSKRLKNPRRFKELIASLDDVGIIIFDETHHASADSWQKIAQKIKAPKRLGLSGTPFKKSSVEDSKLMAVCGPLIVDFGTSTMQKLGYISEADLIIVEQDYSDIGKELSGERWQKVRDAIIVDNRDRISSIVKDIEWYMSENPDARVLVMTGESKKLAISLYEALSRHPWVGVAHGSLPRKEVIKAFERLRSGDLRCVIATKLADEGIDVPGVNAVFLVGGGKSYVKAIQRIGRGLRKLACGQRLLVIDFFAGGHKYLDEHCRKRKEVYMEEEMFRTVEVRTGTLRK